MDPIECELDYLEKTTASLAAAKGQYLSELTTRMTVIKEVIELRARVKALEDRLEEIRRNGHA